MPIAIIYLVLKNFSRIFVPSCFHHPLFFMLLFVRNPFTNCFAFCYTHPENESPASSHEGPPHLMLQKILRTALLLPLFHFDLQQKASYKGQDNIINNKNEWHWQVIKGHHHDWTNRDLLVIFTKIRKH